MKFLFNKEGTRSRKNQVGKHRDQLSGKLDFLLSCAGYTVGIGNIWRFPYLCFKNGGGAFLIAYCITLVIGAYPMFLIDYGIGQFSGKSSINMWAICPLLKGAGYGSIIVSSFMSLYFNVMVSWIFVYMFNSFSLPWTSCNNSWNTPYCFDGTNSNLTVMNMSKSIGYMPFNQTQIHELNTSLNLLGHNVTNHIKVTPNEEFWRNGI